jgi:Lon protease-like protein
MALDGDPDLKNFANLCRLFPLSKVVLFPHAVLPLRIFEPRYLQMTEDALASDKLVTIVQSRTPMQVYPGVEPALEKIACLGRIIEHDRLPDGRINFLLLGRKRVRLGREIKSDKLYRLAEAEILEDENTELPWEEATITEVSNLFLQVFSRHGDLDPELRSLLETGLPLGALTDLIAHALALPPVVKQQLLSETRVDRRARFLIELLQQLDASEAPSVEAQRLFPPPFSDN